MANNPTDPFDNQLNKLPNLFQRDLLDDLEKPRWPGRVDYVAGRVAESNYPIGMESNDRRYLNSGTDLNKAARDHYLRGVGSLIDKHSLQRTLPNDFNVGTFLVEFARLRQGLERADVELPPGEVLGRLITREIKRQYGGRQNNEENKKALLAQQLPEDVQTPHELVAKLSEMPELAEQVQTALPDTDDPDSLADQLGEINLVTELWEHQLEALALWLHHGMNGYVDMATATGKTVIGLAAVAHAVDTQTNDSESLGSLHPADRDRLEEIFDDEIPRPDPHRPRNVLIVTTDDLLGVQWARLFQEHCQTPQEYTKIEGQTITLPQMQIDIQSAGSIDDVDPSDYRVAIFDEVHNYSSGGKWGELLREFIESSCPVLALTGSVTQEFRRLVESAEAEFPVVYRYTHELALSDGVIPDFEWTISFTSVQQDSDVLDRVRTTARYAKDRVKYDPPNLRLSASKLADTDPSLSESERQKLAGGYETGPQVAAALREVGDDTDNKSAPTPELETLAHGLANRSLDRLNLRAQLDQVEKIAEAALEDEQPVLILTRSYSEAEEIWNRLYEGRDDRFVQRIEQGQTAEEQDGTIKKFDQNGTSKKVLIGPGERIGQGKDIQSVEVGINLSRPGSGVNTALVQRLGRLLRNAGGKDGVEFYHVLGVPPEDAIIGPDGESFIRTVAEFFGQVLEPDTDGILKIPHTAIDPDIEQSIIALEQTGAPTIECAEQATAVEKEYAKAIQSSKSKSTSGPVVGTEWFADAFDLDYQTADQDVGKDDHGEIESESKDDQRNETDTADDDVMSEQDISDSAKSVTVDRGIAALVELTASQNETKYSNSEALVEDALTSFLKSTIGTNIDSDDFSFTSERELNFSCDPVLNQLIQKNVAVHDQYESDEELIEAAVFDKLGLSGVDREITVVNYNRYELNIEALIENERNPCDTPGEIVQVALEEFLEIR